MTQANAIGPWRPDRAYVSEGFTPEAWIRTRTSPRPGSGRSRSLTWRTSLAGPCRSYHAARIMLLMPVQGSDAVHRAAQPWALERDRGRMPHSVTERATERFGPTVDLRRINQART